MSLFISSKATGLPYNMVIKDGLVKKTLEPYTEDIAASHFGNLEIKNSIEPLLSLFECEISDIIPKQFYRSFQECKYSGDIPWSSVLPKKMYIKLLKGLLTEIQCSLKKVNNSLYPAFFYETNKIFNMLRPSYIDEFMCKEHLEEGDNHVLKSILAMAQDGCLRVPRYDRVSTKTGRLVIKDGPQVLTLKKDFRDIFKPSSSRNKLYEVDFVSLEPRVALSIAGTKSAVDDVYMSLVDAFDLNVSREAAKIAVLCSLYGAGNHHLNSILKKEGSNVNATTLLKKVKKHFNIAHLTSKLRDEASSGFITNCFGRPIEVDGQRDSILVNNFLQSSAADLALWGFVDFCESMNKMVRPMFVIHDALIFEAAPEHLGLITEYVDKGFKGLGTGTFPLKLTEFRNK